MTEFQFTPQTQIVDPQSLKLTREGFLLLNNINRAVAEATSQYLTLSGTQTVTNKTIDGDTNTLQDIGTESLKTKTGADASVVTGTAGGASVLAMWNGDGDLITASILAALVVTTTGTQTLTNKTLTSPVVNSPTGIVKADVGLGNVDNTSDATKNAAVATLTNKTIGDFLTVLERSADPSDPAEGSFVMWMSDGTGTGDDGDVLVKITAGGVTKTTTLFDFSAL